MLVKYIREIRENPILLTCATERDFAFGAPTFDLDVTDVYSKPYWEMIAYNNNGTLVGCAFPVLW